MLSAGLFGSAGVTVLSAGLFGSAGVTVLSAGLFGSAGLAVSALASAAIATSAAWTTLFAKFWASDFEVNAS